MYLTDTGDLHLVGNDQLSSTNNQTNPNFQNSKFQITDATGKIIERIGAFAESVVGKLSVGLIETRKLIVDSVDLLQKLNELSDSNDMLKKENDILKARIEAIESKLK